MKRIVCGVALAVFAILALLPIGVAIGHSLSTDSGVGLEHYEQAFGPEEGHWHLLLNTLALGVCSTLLALVLGLPYAFLTSRTDMPFRQTFVSLYLLPIILPPLLAAIAWTQIALDLGKWLDRSPKDFLFGGLVGSTIVFGLCYLPFVILFARRAFARIPAAIEEAGLLTVGRWATMRRVVFPLALPGILAGSMFVFLFTICDFTVVDYLNTYICNPLFGGDYGNFRVYPVAAFSKWANGTQTELATALGTPLAVLAILALGLAFHLRRKGDTAVVGTSWREPPLIHLGLSRIPAALYCMLVLTFSFGLPVAALVKMSGSIETYRVILVEEATEIRTTVIYAVLAATLATILAFVLAWVTVHAKPGLGRLLEIAVFLPLAFPPVLFGFGLLVTWNPVDAVILGIGVGNTRLLVPLVLFALVAKYLPFPYIAILTHLRTLERSQEEAAAVAGLPWGQRVWRILVPLSRPGIAVGWVLAFVFCLREIDTLALLTGAESVMFRIYSWIHTAMDDRVAALCVIEISILGLPFLIYGLIVWRKMRVI
jgi:iron(III) transport system permease protein